MISKVLFSSFSENKNYYLIQLRKYQLVWVKNILFDDFAKGLSPVQKKMKLGFVYDFYNGVRDQSFWSFSSRVGWKF